MENSHISAAGVLGRGNRAAGKSRGKQQSAPNGRQQQPKHSGHSRPRQHPGHRFRRKNGKRIKPVDGGDVSLSAGAPEAPPSRQWGIVWPSQAAESEISATSALDCRKGPDVAMLTLSMRDARDIDQLLNIIIKNGESFNHVHTSAALRFLHTKLLWSRSKDTEPTYSVKMTDSQSSQRRSPLLGGEPMCMYIGDVSEPPLPQHGPATWDSHAAPLPNKSPSLEELYAHERAPEAVQGVIGFPPKGSLPGMPPIRFCVLFLSFSVQHISPQSSISSVCCLVPVPQHLLVSQHPCSFRMHGCSRAPIVEIHA